MKYLLCDKKERVFIRYHKGCCITSSILAAKQFNTAAAATNVIDTLPKELKSMNWLVVKASDFPDRENGIPTAADWDNISTAQVRNMVIDDESINGAIQLAESMLESAKSLEKVRDKLSSDLSWCEMATQDILHKIENDKLNAVEQCKLVRKLKEIREKRREVKDQLAIVSNLLKLQPVVSSVTNGIQTIRTKEPVYHPRVLPELFAS